MFFGFSFFGIMIIFIYVFIVYNIKMKFIYKYYVMLKIVNKCEKVMLNKNILEYYYDYVIDLEEVKEIKINVEIYFIFEK